VAADEPATAAQLEEMRARLAEAQAEVERLNAITTNAGASGQREALAVRVAQVEADLAAAVTARDESVIHLRSVIAERDRLGRDFARLKNEQESAAVEHRVALKSARDKLTESQARVQVLEQELDRSRLANGTQAIARDHLSGERDQLKAERDRLAEDVRELKLRLDQAAVTEELPKVRVQLDQELDRIRALTRSLSDAQSQADAARGRVQELETQAAGAQHERDTLQIEIERVKGELLMAQATVGVARDTDHERRHRVEARMQEVLNDREQLLGELSRVNAELMQVRGRLVRAESEAIVADRLPIEQARLRDLEAQVAQQRAEQAATNATLSEVRSQLAAVTAERDRLRDEVERLRAQPSQS
jgi:chromosome segregation ATPase